METTFHEDIFFVLFAFLTNKEMLSLRRTSKFFCHTATKDRFWESRALEKIKQISIRYAPKGERIDDYISDIPLEWIRQYISYNSFFELWDTLRFMQEYVSTVPIQHLKCGILDIIDTQNVVNTQDAPRIMNCYTRLRGVSQITFSDDCALSAKTGMWLKSLTSLTSLSFNDCEFEVVPEYVGALTNLQTLGLTGCKKVSTVPSLPNLTQLYLGRCEKITELPACIEKMTALKTLHISYSGISSLPPFLFSLTKLQHLGMSETKISFLPPEIGNLTSLTHLDITNTLISTIPDEITALTKLDRFSMCDLTLTGVSEKTLRFLRDLGSLKVWMYRTTIN
jgi:hypothetical protein